MGDMGEIYNAMKEESKIRRHKRKDVADSMYFDDFTKHTEWHWSIMLPKGRLDYWPTKNKWHMKDAGMFYGTPQDLRNFVNKRISK